MSNRMLDEIYDLEVQLREIDFGLSAAMRAVIVDMQLIRAVRAKRANIVLWLASAKEAISR